MLPKERAVMQWFLCIFVPLLQLVNAQSTIPDANSILLSNLAPNELDQLLDARLEELQMDVFRVYQDELKQHEKTVDRLERHKRQALIDPVATLVPHDDHYGHSYSFGTGVGNREVVRIDSLDLVGYLGRLTVTDVFPLHLTNLTAIYKDQNGLGYVVVDGNLKNLNVRNEWTASTSGCRCDGASSPVGRSHESCACCIPGACLCRYSLGFTGDACVPCGLEAINCPEAGTKELELDAAVGFEYVLPVTGLQRIVITAKSTVISFFKVDEFGLQIVRSVTGLSTITSAHPVTHLGYGETYVNHYGLLKKKRFLITFSASRHVQQLHELMVGSSDTAIAVGLSTVWRATGSGMKVSQSGGRLMITVLEANRLIVYELKEDLWREFKIHLIQRLNQSVITTWSTFSTGFENYLVLVSDAVIKIYIRKGEYYYSLTTINIDGDIRTFDNILAINLKSCRNEVVLIAGSGARAAVYIWDWSVLPPILRKVNVYDLEVDNAIWKLAFWYSEGDEVRIILPGPTVPTVYALRAHLEAVEDVVWKEEKIVAGTIQNFKDEYRRQNAIMNTAEDRLRDSIDVNSDIRGNITITRSLTISQVLITNILVSNQMSLPGTGGGVDNFENFFKQFNATRNRLNKNIDLLIDIKSRLEGAVLTTGGDRPIDGRLTILNPGLNLQTLITNNINIGQTLDSNGAPVPLEDLLKGLIRVGDGRKIFGQKIFNGALIIGELRTQFLDDVPVSDLVTVGGEQTIDGAIYRSIFFAQEIILKPGATIAGIDLSKAVQLNDFVRIGHGIFQNLQVEGNVQVASNLVNGVDLRRLFQNALLQSGGEVTGTLAFTNDLIISNLDTTEIMGINIGDLLNNVVFKDKAAVLDGRLTVGGRVVVQNLRVDGKFNNGKFLDDYPIKRGDGPIVFRGQKHFSNIKFSKVKFGPQGNVDAIDPDTLVTKSTNQFISGEKIFGQGVHIGGNLEIPSRIIDGVNLDQISRGNTRLPDTDIWIFDVVFTSSVTVPSLLHSGRVNGLDFSAFASDILYNDGPSRVSGFYRFLSGLTVGDAQINGLLNGEDPGTLITTSRNHVIHGTKTFATTVSFNTLVAALVDGVDLNEFANSMVSFDRDGQVFTGKKIFTNTVFISSLVLKGRLSNVDFSKVVTKSGNQIFTALQTLNAATFSDINVQSITLQNGATVNGIDLSEFAARRVTLKSSVDHTGVLIIDGPFTVVGNLMAGSINGLNIQELEQNLVTKNGDSTIGGPVIISNLVVNGNVNTLNNLGANGLSLHDIAIGAAKLEDNRFFGDLQFGDLELRGDINVNGLVNGIHLATLRDDAVYLNSNTLQKVTGTKMFLNGFHVKGDINTDSTNGVDLSTRLFTVHGDQHISAYYTFKNILAKGSVFLLGMFNDIDLKALNSAMRNTQSRYDNLILTGNVKVGELIIDGSLDGVELSFRLSDAVRLEGSGESVTGRKSFTSTTQFRNIDVGRLNSVNFNDFLANVVLRNINKVVKRPMTINGIVSAPWITAENLVVQGGLDGVDYRTLKNNVIYLSRQQNIQAELIFEKSIVVKRNIVATFLNGLSLSGDYLTLRTEQSITVDAHLASIFATFVEVGGLVNGLYLPQLKELTMQGVGGQVVNGITTIKGITKVLRNVEITGRTGRDLKFKLRSEVIDLLTGGEINGLLRFSVMLVTSSLSSSPYLINGIDILSLYNNALFTDRPATITARLVFTQTVNLQFGLRVSGTVDGLRIGGLYNTTSVILAQFGNTTTVIREEYGRMCNSILNLYDQLEDSLYEGDCFDYVYTEVFPEQRHSSHSLTVFNVTYLILSYEEQCYSEVYVWDRFTSAFGFFQSLSATGYAHEFVHVETNDGRVYIAVAASSTNNFCQDRNSTIWEITRTSFQLVKVLVPGEFVSKEILGGKARINVHSLSQTTSYEYSSLNGFWVEVSRSGAFEIAVHVLDDEGFTISFRSNGGTGEIWVDGSLKQTVELGFDIYDVVLVNHHHRIILFVVCSVYTPQGYIYELRAYEIDYGNLVWLHTADLQASGTLSAFFVGNDACGAMFVAITQKDFFPLVYNFFSEKLTQWSQIVVPRTTWIQYFGAPNNRFPQITDHYLLFGRSDDSAFVYSLLMRGSTVPKIESTCEIETFRNPLLKPLVLQ